MRTDLTGRVINHLTVVKELEIRSGYWQVQWQCRCACGKLAVYTTGQLNGKKPPKTCRKCQDHIEHKDAYISWQAAKKRCQDNQDKDYQRYGAKGITFCKEWDDFKIFLRDMGDPPVDTTTGKRMTIDRLDNKGNYEPSNCEWATAKQQANNRG